MSTLTKGEARVLELIKRCDFTGNGCWPTQDELAFLSGYKRPYVNACVKSLERKGRLSIEKRRRPGCKWAHNVYRVPDWSPNVRRGICNLRRSFQEQRSRSSWSSFLCSDTERTATPSRAHAPSRSFPPYCRNGSTSAVVARRNSETDDLKEPKCTEASE